MKFRKLPKRIRQLARPRIKAGENPKSAIFKANFTYLMEQAATPREQAYCFWTHPIILPLISEDNLITANANKIKFLEGYVNQIRQPNNIKMVDT